ncbi:CoA-transferase family III domain-containing protein [Chytriomyces sp. MP71]|nr:CoA-transferase family III domain-containing protein [Chytriomyces sp. MP71]
MPRPLNGVRVIEFAGLAPVPFAGMILSDFGAEVVRIDRLPGQQGMHLDVLGRGKKSVAINLRSTQGADLAKKLISSADVVLDPFRPGVLESLCLGPNEIASVNPRCVVARLTGFGQTGPLAKMAGHDINYIAISGALSLLGRDGEKPIAPANILGDFAGGGMMCVMGILLALLERENSGKGQVVDSSMVDGAAYLSTFAFKMMQQGMWNNPRGQNMLDTGAHFYETYATRDGKFMAVGAIEPQFYLQLLKGLNLPVDKYAPKQMDTDTWPDMKREFATIFAAKTRDEWTRIFHGTDACVTPVLDPHEVPKSNAYIQRWGVVQGHEWNPPPAPRLERTPGVTRSERNEAEVGEHTVEILLRAGLKMDEIEKFIKNGDIGVATISSKL